MFRQPRECIILTYGMPNRIKLPPNNSRKVFLLHVVNCQLGIVELVSLGEILEERIHNDPYGVLNGAHILT